MKRRVVVINHWGGVPKALHRNAMLDVQTALSERTMYSICPVPLTRYDAACGFRAAINLDRPDDMCLIPDEIPSASSLFSMFSEAGFMVVVLGASGIDKGRRPTRQGQRHASEMLPDPCCSMRHVGVSECSLFDGAYFRGAAAAHDRTVLREARSILETVTDKPILVWLNLLSCRDVSCIRFRQPIHPPKVDGILAKLPKTVIDARIKPPSLKPSEDSLNDLRAILNTCDSRAHGEPIDTTSSLERDLDMQYVTLLDSAWATLKTLNEEVRLTMEGMDAEIAVTSTHSLSLGECGTRMSGPFFINCSTFWSSSIDLGYGVTDARSATLPQILFRLVAACGIGVKIPQSQSDTPVCFGKIDHPNGVIFAARALVNINDHHYSCIVTWPRDLPSTNGVTHLCNYELRAVYDASTDPEEKYDILSQVSHLLEAIQQKLRRSFPAHAKVQPREACDQPQPPAVTQSPAVTPSPFMMSPLAPPTAPPSIAPSSSEAFAPSLVPPQPPSAPTRVASPEATIHLRDAQISNGVVLSQVPAQPETPRSTGGTSTRSQPPTSNVRMNEQRNNSRRR